MSTFARAIGLSPGHFTDLMKKRRGLSEAKAQTIASRLSLPPFEHEFFVTSIRSEHSRSTQERADAAVQLARLREQEINVMKLDLFTAVSQWQHFAILELTRLEDFQMNAKWVAGRLGLEEDVARSSLERLQKLGLLKQSTDGWTVHKGFLKAGDAGPSLAIKSHHSQTMTLARKALYDHATETTDFRTTMLAIDHEQFSVAKERLRQFQIEMSELLTTASRKRDVIYCLATQFFSLTKRPHRTQTNGRSL